MIPIVRGRAARAVAFVVTFAAGIGFGLLIHDETIGGDTTTVAQTDFAFLTETVEVEAIAPEDTETTNAAETGVPSGATVRDVGGTGFDDGIAFRVKSIEVVESLPVDEFTSGGPIRPVRGAKLVRVDLTYRNDTKEAVDPFCGSSSAALVDTEDRNFDPIEDQLDIAGNEGYCEDTQPGFQTSVILAFQIPESAQIAGVALWNEHAEEDFEGDTYVFFRTGES